MVLLVHLNHLNYYNYFLYFLLLLFKIPAVWDGYAAEVGYGVAGVGYTVAGVGYEVARDYLYPIAYIYILYYVCIYT